MYSCTCSRDLYQNYIISASLDKEMKLCRHLLVNWCRFRWLISEQRSFNWFVYVDLINVLSAFALFRFSLYRALALALPSQFSIDSIQTDKHTQTIYFIQWVKFGLIFFSPHYQFDKSILSVFFPCSMTSNYRQWPY